MKKIYLILVLLSFFAGMGRSSAQIGVDISYIGPVGPPAYYLKPTVGIEARVLSGNEDSKFRACISVGYYGFKPTQDTFPTVTVESGGANALLPGHEVIKSYSVVPIGFGAEYRPFKSRLSPVIGLEGYFYLIDFAYHNDVQTLINEENESTEWEVAIMPKLGLSYKVSDKLLLSARLGYSIGLTGTVDTQTYWKTSVGFIYIPE